jgi:GR25 family glycosyltransferase involved in LPS biosynthesis
MISDYFDRIFVINLPRSFKRRALMLYQMGKMGIKNFQLVEAVNGSTLDLEKMKAAGTLQWDDWNLRDLTSGEVGCYLSHVKVWKMMIDQGWNRILICEDDIAWRPDANDIADKFMSEVPDDWDIIHFHSHIRVGSGISYDLGRKMLSAHVWKGYKEGRSSACYALTARGVNFLLEIAFPVRYTLDGVINKITSPKWSSEYRGYVCRPFLCENVNLPSDIDTLSQRNG